MPLRWAPPLKEAPGCLDSALSSEKSLPEWYSSQCASCQGIMIPRVPTTAFQLIPMARLHATAPMMRCTARASQPAAGQRANSSALHLMLHLPFRGCPACGTKLQGALRHLCTQDTLAGLGRAAAALPAALLRTCLHQSSQHFWLQQSPRPPLTMVKELPQWRGALGAPSLLAINAVHVQVSED